jgi:hypothetical protein
VTTDSAGDDISPEAFAMKRLVPSVLVLAVALSGAAAAFARDPRDEQERLRPADMRLAKRATLTRADLGRGWKRQPTSSGESDARCPGEPDFSAFTITGKAESSFAHPRGGYVGSMVEVYATKAQAIGDFRLGTGRAFTKCLAHLFDGEFGAGKTKTLSLRRLSGPRIGERSVTYLLAGTLTVRRTTVRVYWDIRVFQRGRSIGATMFFGLRQRIGDQAVLARRMASRMR